MLNDIYVCRTILIGDTCVGKTSILKKFLENKFNPNEANTVGTLFHSYIEKRSNFSIELALWDTAGQEKYRSLIPIYFRGSDAALLVFDLSNRQSFESLNEWLELVRSSVLDSTIIFLVGNKSDLIQERCVSFQEAKQWASNNNCSYFEVSALSGNGIPILIPQLLNQFEKMILTSQSTAFVESHLKQKKDPQPSSCC